MGLHIGYSYLGYLLTERKVNNLKEAEICDVDKRKLMIRISIKTRLLLLYVNKGYREKDDLKIQKQIIKVRRVLVLI